MSSMVLASIPSPTQNVWFLFGVVPLRAYALCIVAGIGVAVWLTSRRLTARGAPAGTVTDVAIWAVPFGIVGARLYHVISTPGPYFGPGGDPMKAFLIWEGGLGIWGAVALGAVGAWLGCRRIGLPLSVLADATAPGLILAQAVGRLGNWFNNELYGAPTELPWGLTVHVMDPGTGRAISTLPEAVHPTFLYELLWNVGIALLLLWAEKRFTLGRGRLFALYIMGYTAGRFWIEIMRTDEAVHVLGLRINVWVSILVFIGGLVLFLVRRGEREELRLDPGGKLMIVTPGEIRTGADNAPSDPADKSTVDLAKSTESGRAAETDGAASVADSAGVSDVESPAESDTKESGKP